MANSHDHKKILCMYTYAAENLLVEKEIDKRNISKHRIFRQEHITLVFFCLPRRVYSLHVLTTIIGGKKTGKINAFVHSFSCSASGSYICPREILKESFSQKNFKILFLVLCMILCYTIICQFSWKGNIVS